MKFLHKMLIMLMLLCFGGQHCYACISSENILFSLLSNRPSDDTIPVLAQQTATRVVEVTWTPVDASQQSVLYRQYPGQSEAVPIATLVGSSYIDHHNRSVCDDTVKYQVMQAFGGVQHHGEASVNVADMEPTAPAEWGVVTVDEQSQQIMLQWNPSRDTDIIGYMVCEGSPSIVIDTVFGRTNTSYTPADYSVDEIFHFRICAFDSCRQASALTSMCNNMVLLLDAEDCDRQVTATWNSYQNMPAGLFRYELWVSENDGAYVEKSRVNDGEETSHVFTVSEEARTIRAYVKAVGTNGDESMSNVVSVTFGTTERPQYLYLRKVSVSDGGKLVSVVGQTDPSFSGTDYMIYRSVDGGEASVVGHCSPSNDGTLRWDDRLTQRLQGVNTYWFGVVDGCGRNEILSQHGSTIVPTIDEQGGVVTVSWNAYEGWTGATQYALLMCADAGGQWTQITSTIGTEANVDIDDGGTLRFKVTAWEEPNSTWQRDDSLQSAVVEMRRRTELWMPNAFTPQENSNKTFGPVFSSVSEEGYSFQIFDRQGMVVFSTTNPADVWDGTANGKQMPAGAYVYRITYMQSDNTEQVKIGTVMLIL